MKNGEWAGVIMMTLVLLAILGGATAWWIVSSSFEAKAFNNATGKSVSTWDAMFIELRVQEGTKD